MNIFFLLAALLLIILVLGIPAYLFFTYRRRGTISRSLSLGLIVVRFPPGHQELGQPLSAQQVREKIGLMEQLYSHLDDYVRALWWKTLLYGKPNFALELTIPPGEEEILFFVAVPRKFVQTTIRLIQGIFPDASAEESKDYNIFVPGGVTIGTHLITTKSPFLPVRTYQKIEGDPMRPIVNALTKIAKEGEGAAIQLIGRPAPERWGHKLHSHAKYVQEGKKQDNIILSALGEATGLKSAQTPEQKKMQEPKRMTPLEEEMLRAIETKRGKQLFEMNIRLVASSRDHNRTHEILRELEASFGQFTDPSMNGFTVARAEGRPIMPFAFEFSFRTFDDSKKIILNTEELTSIFHFPNVPLEAPKVKQLKAREAPPPANLPQTGLHLGYSSYRGETKNIFLQDDDRRRHLYTIGQTGTGKSVFLRNMIIQDIEQGKGLCVIDPHGELVGELLGFIPRHRWQDVVYFNPGDVQNPIGLNMLEYDINFPEQKTFIVNELFSIFQKLYGGVPESMGPIFEQYFRNATMLVMDDPSTGNTMFEIERLFVDKAFRDLKIHRAKNVLVKNFWREMAEKSTGDQSLSNYASYITSKFDVFLQNDIMRPIIVQEKSAFNFREIMDSQKILLVNLTKGRLGDINSSLIGLIIVGKILMAALSRIDMEEEKRKDFFLYIDEFQNVTTDSIATILSEARKYRLGLVITHQFIGQLKEEIKKAVFGNVGSMVTFRIGSDDAEFMAKQYKPQFVEHDLLNIDNYNAYVKLLIRGATSQPFSMKTIAPKKGDPAVADAVKEMSRVKYGRPRDEVEAEIVERNERL